MIKSKILYISYDGVLEPLGQSQVMNYQLKISEYYEIIIVSFEKLHDLKNKKKIEAFRKSLSSKNIIWYPIKYSKNIKLISFHLTLLEA